MVARTTALFPLWTILFSVIAYAYPTLFVGFSPAVVYLLGIVMFGMGMTLTPGNFAEVMRRPGLISLGVALQYFLMPLIAWGVSLALDLPSALLIGMVLVGACPGGTASNVICYLARGDVALSITLTTFSTLLAVVATPFLTLLYAGQVVDVPVVKMLLEVLKIVIAPVAAGVLINYFIGQRMRHLKKTFPLISVLAIVMIIAIVVALNQSRLNDVAITLITAVFLHNALGLMSGYGLPKLLGLDERTCRTVAIEVGMQNSGLAVALAVKFFAPFAALPGALFSIWHIISGSLLAAWWPRDDA